VSGSGASAAALDRTIAALADPQRRRAVDLLGARPHRAGELAAALGVTPSVMSKHLKVLRTSGIVEERHPDFDARVRVYSLRAAPMAELRAWLETAERGWVEQLTAFREHLERERDLPVDRASSEPGASPEPPP
jgi:DNA-binding transcriptional ArsR family regulator